MATYNGSGRYVKLQTGKLLFGNGTTEYANLRPTSYTRNNVTYYGVQDYTASYLNLPNLSELTVGGYKGYTGTIKMCTNFTTPNRSVIIFDLDYEDIADITVTYTTYRFVNGFCVGTV